MGETHQLAISNKCPEILTQYENLYNSKKYDPYFLYSFAIESYLKKDFNLALNMATECRSLWANYNLELLLGEIYIALNNNKEALEHYKLAAQMCPVRFVPLYKQYLIYKKTHNTTQCRKLAQEILKKPIKVHSTIIDNIIAEIRMDFGIYTYKH